MATLSIKQMKEQARSLWNRLPPGPCECGGVPVVFDFDSASDRVAARCVRCGVTRTYWDVEELISSTPTSARTAAEKRRAENARMTQVYTVSSARVVRKQYPEQYQYKGWYVYGPDRDGEYVARSESPFFTEALYANSKAEMKAEIEKSVRGAMLAANSKEQAKAKQAKPESKPSKPSAMDLDRFANLETDDD